MKFEKLEFNNTDLKKVSKLMYESNEENLKYVFGKNKEKAQNKIEKIIRIGKNHYGYENIYVAYDENVVAGFFIGFTGQEQEYRRKNTDFLTFLKLMRVYGITRYKLFVRPLFMRISLVDIKKDDFYVDGMVIDENYRDAAVDFFLLDKVIDFAKNKDCKRLVADISLGRLDEKKFYEKAGFKVYDKKVENIKHETIGNYFMEYMLE